METTLLTSSGVRVNVHIMGSGSLASLAAILKELGTGDYTLVRQRSLIETFSRGPAVVGSIPLLGSGNTARFRRLVLQGICAKQGRITQGVTRAFLLGSRSSRPLRIRRAVRTGIYDTAGGLATACP